MKIQSVKDLEKITREYSKQIYYPETLKVNIGMASCGIAAGAQIAFEKATEAYKKITGYRFVKPDASAFVKSNLWWKFIPTVNPVLFIKILRRIKFSMRSPITKKAFLNVKNGTWAR